MSYRTQLFRTENPYDLPSTEALFFRAMKENCIFHYEHCGEYRKILDSRGFSPADMNGYEGLCRLPFLPTLLFKKHELYSLPSRRMLIQATSSGTSGMASRIGFETSGLWCGLQMVLKIIRRRRLLSPRPAHYMILGYQPSKGNETAVTKTAFGATLFAPALSRTYALRKKDGQYKADLEGVLEAIVKRSRTSSPVRFMGFPSYTYFLLRLMEQRGVRVTCAPGSKIMLGGGWKQFYAEQVDKRELYSLAADRLGIGEEDIVEFYGAVEHPILYCDCIHHHFHVPVYSRVIIRDVHSLEPVKNETPGLVNLLTPMVKATPILSVMTDDLGVLHEGGECGCGNPSPYLEILGRIGLRDIKTCAAGAAEILKGVGL